MIVVMPNGNASQMVAQGYGYGPIPRPPLRVGAAWPGAAGGGRGGSRGGAPPAARAVE